MIVAALPAICAMLLVVAPQKLPWQLVLLAAGFALWALCFPLVSLMIRRQDLSLDRAAISLTGDPDSYLSAIERAAKFTPREQHFPWWFRPVSLQARQDAIRRQFSSLTEATQTV